VRLRRTLPVWVLGTLAKRWTAVLQPEGFDSPILRTTPSNQIGIGSKSWPFVS